MRDENTVPYRVWDSVLNAGYRIGRAVCGIHVNASRTDSTNTPRNTVILGFIRVGVCPREWHFQHSLYSPTVHSHCHAFLCVTQALFAFLLCKVLRREWVSEDTGI